MPAIEKHSYPSNIQSTILSYANTVVKDVNSRFILNRKCSPLEARALALSYIVLYKINPDADLQSITKTVGNSKIEWNGDGYSGNSLDKFIEETLHNFAVLTLRDAYKVAKESKFNTPAKKQAVIDEGIRQGNQILAPVREVEAKLTKTPIFPVKFPDFEDGSLEKITKYRDSMHDKKKSSIAGNVFFTSLLAVGALTGRI